MPGLSAAQAPAPGTRHVGYADPRRSDLIIHHMPGHLILRLRQVAVKLFFVCAGVALIPVQFAALAAVAQRPRIDQVTLSALIGYDRATIGRVIDRLESKGFLARSASRADRRVKLVRITAIGSKALARALPAVRKAQALLLEPLGAAERKRFERLCLKILAHHLG